MAAEQRSRSVLVVAAVAVVAVLLMAVLATVLGGGDERDGGGPGTSSATTAAGGPESALARDAEKLTRALLAPADDPAPAVAAAQGTVQTNEEPRAQPAVAEILAVEVGPSSILLRWRLRSTAGSLDLDGLTFAPPTEPSSSSLLGVALVDPVGRESVRPYVFRAREYGVSCVCSIVPVEIDRRGQELSGLYPLFTTAPAQVEVHIPGFPPIGVPVTRR